MDYLQQTNDWIAATLKHFSGRHPDDLTQIYMRGPFAGWSEREVFELATLLKTNNKEFPLHPEK